MKKTLCLLLMVSLILPVMAACEQKEEKKVETVPGESQGESQTETTEPDPFAGFNYDGKAFRIYTSTNDATVTLPSSNYLIQAEDEEHVGDAASEAAHDRNLSVEELLNIKFQYTQVDLKYDSVANDLRTYMRAADDLYDLIINDVYGIAPCSNENYFYNILEGEYFDFDQPWWYKDFMEDISINSNVQYMLCGDFFIDLLRCSHCLVFNKDFYTDVLGDPAALYQTVLEGKWTMDEMYNLVNQSYNDANGDGVADAGDRFGYTASQDWGPAIPFLVSCDPGYIARDEEGYPVITMNNERTVSLVDKLSRLWKCDGTAALSINNDKEENAVKMFTEGRALFVGYQRLGSLETDQLRSTEYEIGIVPYPKLDEQQKDYITSSHDTAELGAIPKTVARTELSFISAVVEVLCRETYRKVLPVYYEESLKFKYTRDSESGQMIDIIHDHMGNSFILAWSQSALGGFFMQSTVHAAAMATSNNFASRYKSQEKSAQKKLNKMIEDCRNLLEEGE